MRCVATRRAWQTRRDSNGSFLLRDRWRSSSPLLDGFGQDVRVETDAAGRPTRAINHMLKLFLIDSSGVVREIYSLAFVHPEVMLNDIQTLLMESDRTVARN